MKYLATLFIALLILSCQSDNESDVNNPNGPEISDEASYDPSLIPPPNDPLPNLLTNAGFENDDAWLFCGDVNIVSSPDAFAGSQMAELANGSFCQEAKKPFFTSRNAIMIQPLNIDELPELLTISFWIKSDGSLPENGLRIFIANSPSSFLNSLAGGASVVSYFSEESISNDWTQVKLYYEKEDSFFISNEAPLSLVFQLETSLSYQEPFKIYIDEVKVSDGHESFTQLQPMPEGLINYESDKSILFFNNTTGKIATMHPNGERVINFNQIPTEFLAGIPSWFSNTLITVPEKIFNPSNPSSTNTIPASGTDVFNYAVEGGEGTLIYQTIGDPGFYSIPLDPNNKEAIDIEVRRTAWDLERNRGALTVCARSRLTAVTSDDICNIVIVNKNDFSEIAVIEKGFNPSWSSTGRLAYYYDNTIFIADIAGNTVNTTTLHENSAIGGLLQEVDWSPDGTKIAFAEKGGGVSFVNGTLISFFTIKTLEVATGKISSILAIDHGQLRTNLSWSPDGKYIIYSLQTDTDKSEIWWLEIASGKTGPITNTIEASFGYWQK